MTWASQSRTFLVDTCLQDVGRTMFPEQRAGDSTECSPHYFDSAICLLIFTTARESMAPTVPIWSPSA